MAKKPFLVALDPTLLEDLRRRAAEEGVSMATLIRRAVRLLFKQEDRAARGRAA